jgi:ubiquinone biosynthesis protein
VSGIESFVSNLHIARNLIVEGRERYISATKAAVSIEQIYRKARRQSVRNAERKEEIYSEAHSESADVVCDLCRQNGASWVKFAQFLSCRPDILPMEYIVKLQSMQSAAIPATFEKIHPMIIETWGEDWDQRFESFDVVPIATASVAQVHRATLKGGRQVAVKIQMPQVRELFEQDSLVFTTMANILNPLIKELDLKQITQQLIAMTMDELDFMREASNLHTFSQQVQHPSITVPGLIDELCSDQILVTDWMDGQALQSVLTEDREKARDALGILLESYLQQIMRYGVYHADPHPGNFILCDDGRIAILDYGAIATLSTEERTHYSA